MIERAIENWLINTNERNYQSAFCQVLMNNGHKVIYISTHGQMEQGKDVITVDKSGNYCAYQLKTGNIDLRVWREIKGEVQELIELPIVHPSVSKKKLHKSYLVTNGELTDGVRIQIGQINEDNRLKGRRYSYLEVINGQTLLKEFVDAQGKFIPKELEEIQLFLELFLSDGSGFIDKGKLFNLFNETIFDLSSKRKSDYLNAVYSSIVICAYITKPFQLKNNYFSLFEAWTCLGACILRLAYSKGLKRKDWYPSFELVMSEIFRNLDALKEETLGRKDFLEGSGYGDGGLIYRSRATIVLGTLAALEVNYKHQNKDYKMDERILELITYSVDGRVGDEHLLFLWGESAFPYFLNLINYLEIVGQSAKAIELLVGIYDNILQLNGPRKDFGLLPNPYYSVYEILSLSTLGVPNDIDFSHFSGSSYLLKALVHMIARRDGRRILEVSWRPLTHMQMQEFIPDHEEDFFAWRTNEGLNHSEFPISTQSWKVLKEEAFDPTNTPQILREQKDFLRFFTLVCPHRINHITCRILDQI
jgi:hypothetical protein